MSTTATAGTGEAGHPAAIASSRAGRVSGEAPRGRGLALDRRSRRAIVAALAPMLGRPAAELAADPLFELANHGTVHLPLSVRGAAAYGIAGTADPGAVFDEISGNRRTLTELTGVAPRFFRSGTAHYDDVAVRIAGDLGEAVVNFDVNGDAGATFGPREVTAALGSVSAGSIVIGHMNQPSGGTAAGVAAALPRLTAEGFRFVRLSEHL